MLSMTGFGRSSVDVAGAGLRIQVEIHSVNRKTLDIQISAPREWSGHEAIFSEWIGGAFQRGRVNVQIKVELAKDSSDSLAMNTEAMALTRRGHRARVPEILRLERRVLTLGTCHE